MVGDDHVRPKLAELLGDLEHKLLREHFLIVLEAEEVQVRDSKLRAGAARFVGLFAVPLIAFLFEIKRLVRLQLSIGHLPIVGTRSARDDQGADLIPLGHVMGQRSAGLVKGIRGMRSNNQNANGI